jgi:hypothetical protein
VSDLVFKYGRHIVWRLIIVCLLAFWALVATAVRAEVTGITGVDMWRTPADPARYLPNYATPNPWRSASPWVQAQGRYQLGDIALTAAGRWDAVNGGRVDRLDADMRLSASSGVRVGVLPYRVAWCRAHDPNSPWMSEPDAFCRFSGLAELAAGAAGVQAYRSGRAGGWLIDGMAGVYLPKIDGQATSLGPYVKVGPDVAHSKWGASVNALHLPTGIQTRAAWLRTHQVQDSDAGGYQRHIDYDTVYLAAEGSITPALDMRASMSAYIGQQFNPANPYKWDGRSLTVEAIYKPATGHTIATGLSRYVNMTTYATDPNHQRLIAPSLSLAWRKDWPGGVYTVLQGTRTLDESTTRKGAQTRRDGSAIGLRVSKIF